MPELMIQSSFQYGEVSPLLHSQVESGIYYKAARRLRNVLVIPQGGVEKRFGLLYAATISGITDYRLVKPFLVTINGVDQYLLVFVNLAILIYHNNALVATVVSTYTAAQVSSIRIAQTNNFVVICNEDHTPATLIRVAAHATWTLNATPTFVHYPTYDFLKNYDTATFTIQIAGTPIIADQNLIGAAVTIESSIANVFTTNHVGGLFYGDGGIVRITTYVSDDEVIGYVTQVFDADSSMFVTPFTILGTQAVVTEVVFSTTRGWPREVAFYQNRLFFAKTTSLLNGVWGSNFDGYSATKFLFNDALTLDTSAISTLLTGKKNVVIEHIVPAQTLVIMTNAGIYSTPLLGGAPLTPSNIDFINRHTSDASSSVPPLVFDDQIVYFSLGGKKVKSLNVNDSGVAYVTKDISVLASHLIDTPYSAGVFENSSIKNGAWVLMVNSGSTYPGTLAIFQQVPEQEINAWTLSTTDGYFRHVAADDDFVYFIIERVINSATVLMIEKLDFSYYTDASYTNTYGSPTATVTGLSYLEGEEVAIVGDGAVMASKTVTSGSITLDYEVTTVKLGLPFTPLIRPMAINVPTQNGNNLFLPKTIKSIFIDFVDSDAIEMNGELIRPFLFDVDEYNVPVTLKTGYAQLMPMRGWSGDAVIDITQSVPMPFTVIGLGFMVESS